MRGTTELRPREVKQLWVCYECATLVERPPHSTGIVLCSKHEEKEAA